MKNDTIVTNNNFDIGIDYEWIVDGDKPVMYALLDKAEKDKKEH